MTLVSGHNSSLSCLNAVDRIFFLQYHDWPLGKTCASLLSSSYSTSIISVISFMVYFLLFSKQSPASIQLVSSASSSFTPNTTSINLLPQGLLPASFCLYIYCLAYVTLFTTQRHETLTVTYLLISSIIWPSSLKLSEHTALMQSLH